MNGEWFVLRRAPCGVCSGDGIVWRGDQAKNCPHCEGVGHIATEMPLVVALRDLGIDVDTIQQAQRQAQRAADVASMLANGILPD